MSLPAWTVPLLGGDASRAADRWAIDERQIPSLTLMETASAGLAALVQEVAPEGEVVVVCGGGNNGGDGYACARLLREAWRDVRVLAASDPAGLKGDAAVQVQRLPGEPPRRFEPAALEGAAVIVDALLGTGFSDEPRGLVGEAIAAIAQCGVPVVACDVPSGVDAATGEIAGAAVRAVATATFHGGKPGLYVNPGKDHAGVVRVVDIGIPSGAPVPDPDVGLIDDDALLAALPTRGTGWTKFTSGHVLVAGGSRGLLGATILASEAAAARRRGLRDGLRARIRAGRRRGAARRGHAAGAPGRGRAPRGGGRARRARRGPPARRRARPRARARAQRGGGGLRACGGRPGAGGARARRGRAERPRGAPGGPRGARAPRRS